MTNIAHTKPDVFVRFSGGGGAVLARVWCVRRPLPAVADACKALDKGITAAA